MGIRIAIIISSLLLAACGSTKKTSMINLCQDGVCSQQEKGLTQTPAVTNNTPQSPEESYQLALRYFRGDGVEQDSYQAIKALTHAAENGLQAAQITLGEIYLYGLEEMGSDPAQAERWLSAAAPGGSSEIAELLTQARNEKRNQQERYQWEQKWQQRRNHFYHFLYNTQRHRSTTIIKVY